MHKISVMKKLLSILVAFATFFCINAYGQNPQIPIEGKCSLIIEKYREAYKSDSIAIVYFKSNYTIESMSSVSQEVLFKKKPSEIISYFNSEEGKKYDCYLRGHRSRND